MTRTSPRRNVVSSDEPIDAVPAVLSQPPGSGRRGGKAKRDRSWDAKRTRVAVDLPPDLIANVKTVVAELEQQYHGVRVQDVYRLLLEAGLADYHAGRLEIKTEPAAYRVSFQTR